MTDTANAPERIWMTAEDHGASWSGAFRAFRCSDLDHSNDDGPNPDYPEYVLATHCDELVAAAYENMAAKAFVIAVEMELHAAMGATTKVKADAIEDAIRACIPDNARAALTARDERMKSEGAREAQAKIEQLEALADALRQVSGFNGYTNDGRISITTVPETKTVHFTAADMAEANAKIARLTEALKDVTDALGEFVDKETQLALPYEHPLSAYDRALKLLQENADE